MVEVTIKRLGLLFLLTVAAGGGWVRGADVDLYTPEMQKLKKEYLQRSGSYIKSRHDDLSKLVQDQLKQAQTSLDEKTTSGNVTGMAIWKKAVAIFEQCAQELKDKKDFEVPEKVRRDLTQTMDDFRREKKAIEEKYGVLINPLRDHYYQIFAAKARSQPAGQGADDAQLRQWFADLVASADPTTKAPAPAGETPKTGGPATTGEGPKEPAIVVPDVVGTSGNADQWATFARWYAEVSSVEVINIPVMGVSEVRKSAGESMGENTGASYSTRFEPIRVLSPSDKLVFRIKSIPKRLAADILEWPNPGNNWVLSLRLRPGETLPSNHGLELQVNADARTAERTSEPAGETPAVAGTPGGEAPKPVEQKAKIKVTTTPAGALVYVDGQLHQEGRSTPRTPCMVQASTGKHEIKLVMVGYVDGILKDFEFKTGATADWTFLKDRSVDETTVKAFARTGWRTSRVKVGKGDQMIIGAYGSWNAGGGRPDAGPDGYASTVSYSGPTPAARRLVANANFGALIMRIGEKGAVRPVGRAGVKLIADEEGEIFFGINEAESALSDNSGSVTVRVQKFGGSGSAP